MLVVGCKLEFMEGYCVKCKAKREMKDSKEVEMKGKGGDHMKNNAFMGLLVSKYGSKVGACKKLKLTEWRMSRVINGWDELRPDEIEKLNTAFGEDVVNSVVLKRERDNRSNVA